MLPVPHDTGSVERDDVRALLQNSQAIEAGQELEASHEIKEEVPRNKYRGKKRSSNAVMQQTEVNSSGAGDLPPLFSPSKLLAMCPCSPAATMRSMVITCLSVNDLVCYTIRGQIISELNDVVLITGVSECIMIFHFDPRCKYHCRHCRAQATQKEGCQSQKRRSWEL